MMPRDTFIKEFEKLLGTIPSDYSLEEYQYAYKEVIFSLGMKILNVDGFRADILGPKPSATGAGRGAGSQPGGGAKTPGKGSGPSQDGAGPGPGAGGRPYSIIICIVNGVLQLVPPK